MAQLGHHSSAIRYAKHDSLIDVCLQLVLLLLLILLVFRLAITNGKHLTEDIERSWVQILV
jgi:hypothetical protein